jgi:hypothetical protein
VRRDLSLLPRTRFAEGRKGVVRKYAAIAAAKKKGEAVIEKSEH